MDKHFLHKPEYLERLTLVLASVPEAVIIAEKDGGVVFANQAVEIMLGFLPQDLIGKKVQEKLEFKCPAEAPAYDFFKEALTGWRAVDLPLGCKIVRPNSKPVPVAATATPLYTYEGDYAGIVLVLRDLSEEIRRRERQYEFLSFVSHQFRQPVGSIRWGLEVVMDSEKSLGAQSRELLNDLHAITLRFKNFINDLIDISRLEEGRVEVKSEELSLREVVERAVQELKGIAVSNNVSVKLFPGVSADEKFLIQGDKERLHDVFMNLISNAVLYNNPRGSVTVDAKMVNSEEIRHIVSGALAKNEVFDYLRHFATGAGEDRNFLLVTVSDTGMGIPKEQQVNVFEGFFRGKNVVERGIEGTGLGLYIAKTIIERHGGKMFFKSEEGTGTVFYLLFQC